MKVKGRFEPNTGTSICMCGRLICGNVDCPCGSQTRITMSGDIAKYEQANVQKGGLC